MSRTKLSALRIANNWEIEDVANSLEISADEYAKIESGKARLTMDIAKKLSELYRIDPEYFFTHEAVAIHKNEGQGSNSNSGYINTYNNNGNLTELFEKLLKELERERK
jgi:transcriptional regulator with XRE-family HTH domain